MHRIYQGLFLISSVFFSSTVVIAQTQVDSSTSPIAVDSTPVSVNPALNSIFDSKSPRIYTISNITVTGSKSFDQNLITSISGLAVGDKVQIPGTDEFSKAINKLWKQNLISNAEIYFTSLSGTNLSIEIAITERPRLSDYDIVGIKKTDKEDLKKKIGLSKEKVVTEDMKLNTIDVIKKFFDEKGYQNITVTVKEEVAKASKNTVKLTFFVDKGNKVKVNSINFVGDENASANKLKKQMSGTHELTRFTFFPPSIPNPYNDTTKKFTLRDYTHEYGFLLPTQTALFIQPYFHPTFANAKFNPEKYAEDKDKILDYYNSKGYRDAQIVADTNITNEEGNRDIFIKVAEGSKYYFGNISWRGNTKYSDSILTLILGIHKGDIYNQGLLNKRLGKQLTQEGGDVGSLYLDDGYLFFHVDAIETAVYNDTIDFEIRMQEGPQATIGRVDISGNEKTKDYVIRRELRTIPGEKFSRADIIRTQRELSQLGFFNPEKITPNIVPNADNGTVDIGWSVEEKSSDQLELSAGFGGGIGLTGTLGVTFNNFSVKNILKGSTWDPLPSGDGQKLSARVQSNGKSYRSFNFSFTEPWLGGRKRNSFTTSVYSTKNANSYGAGNKFCLACADTSYIKTIGVSFSLGKQLTWPDDYFSLIYTLNFQQYRLRNYPNIFRGLDNGNATNISLKIALARSAAQGNPIYPTGGSNMLVSSQFTLPYSLMGISTGNGANPYELPEFHKWRFDEDFYIPLGQGHGADKSQQFVLKVAAKLGYIGRYNSKLQISPFDRFQLGDAGLSNTFAVLGYDIISQRGYPVYASSDPKVNPENITPQEFFTIFNKYTVELRYPFSLNPSSTIFGTVFFEAANGWYDLKDYNPFVLRRSVGVGARFYLPLFGLLGFDYGLGIDRIQAGEPLKGAFKFTFLLGQEPE
ncbi:MAG TPA: POTRA domain-containing protein [Ferruginibacter sp.]|nr:POTRA domain-containing protein [Ferruginibacter sp.]